LVVALTTRRGTPAAAEAGTTQRMPPQPGQPPQQPLPPDNQ